MKTQNAPWTGALFVLFGIIVLGAIATLIGAATIDVVCGASARPGSVFAGLQLAVSGSAAGFTGVAGCTAPVVLTRVLDLIAVLLIIAAGIAGWLWWLRYRKSDRYFVRELRGREGFARPGEVRRRASARAMRRRGTAGWKVGRAHNREVYVPIEDPLVVEAAPRSAAGRRFVVGAIVEWEGPLVTTATRNDSLTATMRERARRGQVTVFDPQELSGVRSSLRVSPLAGCIDPLVAERRAQAIVAGTALGASGREWAPLASSVLSRLLHAAAVSGRGLDELALWGSNPRLAQEAVSVLADHGAPGWAAELDAAISGAVGGGSSSAGGEEKRLASAWLVVAEAVRPLEIPAIRKVMTPGFSEQFDADWFLTGPNSLYLIGAGTGPGSVGGFLAAVLDDVVETARRKALASPGSRLAPPLALILDEIASMFWWPALPRVMADGGTGISTVVVLDTLAQAEAAWSRTAADSVWSAGTAKLLLGGASDLDRLRDIETLLGTRRVRGPGTGNASRPPGGSGAAGAAGAARSARPERVPVVTADELRRMPDTMGLLAYPSRRGILLDLGMTRRAARLASDAEATGLDQRLVLAEQYQAALDRRHTAQERG